MSDRERDTHARENRVLMNLQRGARTSRQLWQIGGRNALLAALERAGLIWGAGEPNATVWAILPAGERELAQRMANGLGFTVASC